MSPGFPLHYSPNEKCKWLIEVESNSYIQLTFSHFDIFEEESNVCIRDHVAVYNIKTNEDGDNVQDVIGLYCNTNKPPDIIYSNWNKMMVEFNTDYSVAVENSGFVAMYDSIQYLASEIDDQYDSENDTGFTGN